MSRGGQVVPSGDSGPGHARGRGAASREILGVRVDATSYGEATRLILEWARSGSSRYVCACNVHMVMEAHDDPSFRDVVNGADLVTPDGVPLVWTLRRLGLPSASRVYGPDLMLEVCAAATDEGVPVALHGGTPDVLRRVSDELLRRYPRLEVAYAESPPFRPVAKDPDATAALNRSGARIVFVALGCPKQERWMHLHRGAVDGVMLGVGAAFDFLAGTKRQAPSVVQRAGLEWAFRLATEPRRLWRRYAVHNPRFVIGVVRQLLRRRGERG